MNVPGIDRWVERNRCSALAAGDLIDFSREARAVGIALPLAISRSLVTGLIRPYPSSQPRDYLPLASLLDSLKELVAAQQVDSPSIHYLTPKLLPEWIGDRFPLRVRFAYFHNRPMSITVAAPEELFIKGQSHSAAALPATLLMRHVSALHSLGAVARTADHVLLHRIIDVTSLMLSTQPLREVIKSAARKHALKPPEEFTHNEYRQVLVATLGQSINHLAACQSQVHSSAIEGLGKLYAALDSPLSDLAELTEQLMQLAARLRPLAAECCQSPFGPLLRAIGQMQMTLDRVETSIPSDVIITIRSQLAALARLVPPSERDTLLRLQDAFGRIDHTAPPGQLVDMLRSSADRIVWQ